MEQLVENAISEPLPYTVEYMASMLQIGQTTACNITNSGEFKTAQIGTTIRISRKSFNTWLDEQMD